MIQKFKKFTKLSAEEKKLFIEAYVLLGIMRSAILTVSFKRLTRSLDHREKKDEEGKNKMKAHIWSQCGDVIITGSGGYEAFAVWVEIGRFGTTKRQDKI